MSKFNIKSSSIQNQRSGYSYLAYIAVQSEMDVISGDTDGVIASDHTFDVATPALGFMEVYNLPKKPESSTSTTGEEGGLNGQVVATLFIPGDSAAVDKALEAIRNEPLIVLLRDATPGGIVRQLGDEQNPCWVQSESFRSGTLADGTKGTEVQVYAPYRYDYQGTITIME